MIQTAPTELSSTKGPWTNDRWGELIFHSTDVYNGWNGYYKGRLSPQDSYIWKVRARFTDGVEKNE